ncbi:16325_t:CDS:2, partial [Cetraspora pellucida]
MSYKHQKYKITRDTHIRAIKLALKTPASPKPPSIQAAASSFGIAEAILRHAMKKDCLPNHSSFMTVLSSYEEEQLVDYYKNIQWSWQAPKVQKVLAEKGICQVHKIVHGNSHDHISVAPTILAADDYILPLIIYKGIHAISGLLNGASSDMVIGFTNSGYMCEELFQMYIKHFISSISPCYSVLLMLNGHSSHINYMSINFCHENGILLYVLPSYTTHILQPSELSFAKLKTKYSKNCDQLHHIIGELVTKTTGIWSFNPNTISPHHLNPSLTT